VCKVSLEPKIHYISFPVLVHNRSVTSWRGQKSVVSVVSCRFPNFVTTTCCQLVADLLAVSLTSPQQVHNKLAASPSTGKLGETCVMEFWH